MVALVAPTEFNIIKFLILKICKYSGLDEKSQYDPLNKDIH